MNMLLYNRSQTVNIRTERHENREYLVAPVVMMVEGVHCGSGGCTFYSAAELSAYAQTWNNVPVTVEHPVDGQGQPISANQPEVIERQAIGHVFNTYWDGRRLMGEIWVDVAKAGTVVGGAETLRYLRQAIQLQVSTGHFGGRPGVGNWNGEDYERIAENIRPDHLALLPGGTGACNWDDGCGVRANKNANKGAKSSGEFKMKLHELAEITAEMISNAKDKPEELRGIAVKFGQQMGFSVQELGHEATAQMLQGVIDSWDRMSGPGSPLIHYLREVYDDTFVYSVSGPREARKLYRLPYSVNDTGVTIDESASPTEVMKKPVEYIDVNANEENVSPLVQAAQRAAELYK